MIGKLFRHIYHKDQDKLGRVKRVEGNIVKIVSKNTSRLVVESYIVECIKTGTTFYAAVNSLRKATCSVVNLPG